MLFPDDPEVVQRVTEQKYRRELEAFCADKLYPHPVIWFSDPTLGSVPMLHDPRAKFDGLSTSTSLIGGHWETEAATGKMFFLRPVPAFTHYWRDAWYLAEIACSKHGYGIRVDMLPPHVGNKKKTYLVQVLLGRSGKLIADAESDQPSYALTSAIGKALGWMAEQKRIDIRHKVLAAHRMKEELKNE